MASRTVGVDLASQPENTAVCVIDWGPESAHVTALECGRFDGQILDDATLLGLMLDADKVAIDAPFGWPEPFTRAISSPSGTWPLQPDESRAALALRTTDRLVRDRTGKTPLSVTTDRIAYCAMRCQALLSALASPRDGSGQAVEAYPDATLRSWLPELFNGKAQSYKTKASMPARQRRGVLLGELMQELGDNFIITDAQCLDIAQSDDHLDALVCALVARAAAIKLTVLPATEEHRNLAQIEGWIHLPEPGSLPTLINLPPN